MSWFHEFGFKFNPLTTNVETTVSQGLVTGLEEQEILLKEFIDSGEIVFIVGPMGIGKTTLLMSLHKQYLQRFNSFFVSCSLNPEFDVWESIRAKRNVLEKIIGKDKPKKESIFFLNELQYLDQFTGETLKTHAKDFENIKSIVCASVNLKNLKVDQAFLDRVGSRVFELKPLNKEQAYDILYKRLGIHMLNDSDFNSVFKASKGIPRKLLENAELFFVK